MGNPAAATASRAVATAPVRFPPAQATRAMLMVYHPISVQMMIAPYFPKEITPAGKSSLQG